MSSPSACRVLLISALATALGGAPRRASAGDRPVVHALVAIDTKTGLAGLDRDLANVKGILSALPGDRVDMTVFTGDQISRASILQYFRSVRMDPEDTLLLYYSGHGATDPNRGHTLDLSTAPPLFRTDLRAEMMRRNPRLIVIISDSCSNHKLLDPAAGARRSPGNPNPKLVEHLLFGHRGLIDINSSTYSHEQGIEQVSWGEPRQGGLFTHSLYNMMCRTDLPEDIRWHEFVPRLQAAAQECYANYRRHTLSNRGSLSNDELQMLNQQTAQTPQTLSVGPPEETVLPTELKQGRGNDSELRLGLSVRSHGSAGVVVTDVAPGSPAAERGFDPGDIILDIDGSPISTEDQFTRAIDRVVARGTVRFVILNKGNNTKLSIAVRLGR